MTRPESSRASFLAEGSTAGVLFLAGPVAGYFLGKWLGQWLGLGSVPAWIGAALGLVSAFVHLLRLVSRISR
ncbi:MAG TPA: AtpZ/AtpI family protein [Thermoanaerobaculia bacterium]|nr:AtpZ/AtpI family protein [Thermoanaerobaculia bacterium]